MGEKGEGSGGKGEGTGNVVRPCPPPHWTTRASPRDIMFGKSHILSLSHPFNKFNKK